MEMESSIYWTSTRSCSCYYRCGIPADEIDMRQADTLNRYAIGHQTVVCSFNC